MIENRKSKIEKLRDPSHARCLSGEPGFHLTELLLVARKPPE
ncbi:MAG TPA: hypothetical protein VMN57_11555 [Anaerolineales bacterium]|nr:hypothetical protein [Anaerolineales bacterium]